MRTLDFSCDGPGTIYLWIDASGGLVQARVTNGQGWTVEARPEETPSEAATVPCTGSLYEVTLAMLGPEPCAVRVHVDVAREDEASRSATERGRALLEELRTLGDEGVGEEGVQRLNAWLDGLEALPGSGSKALDDVLWDLGESPPLQFRYDVLVRIWDQVLLFTSRFLPPAHPDALLAAGNRAEALCGLGRHPEAREDLERLLSLSLDDAARERVWASLARVHEARGDRDSELRRLRQAFDSLCTSQGEARALGREVRPRLVALLTESGRKAEAEDLSSRYAETEGRPLARALSLRDLANEELASGRHEAAMDHRREAVRLLVDGLRTLPPARRDDAEEAVRVLEELGTPLANHGENELAETAFVALTGLLGEWNPEGSVRLQFELLELATLHFNLGEREQALREMKGVLAVMERTLSERDPRRLEAMNRVGIVTHRIGDHVQGARILERVLELRREILAPDDPALRRTLEELTMAWHQSANHGRAFELGQEVLGLAEKDLPAASPELQRKRRDTAALAYNAGRLPDASFLYEEMIAAWEADDADHTDQILGARMDLADTLVTLGEPSRALEIQADVVGQLEQRLDDGHDTMLRARRVLATILEACGRPLEAQQQLRRAVRAAERSREAGDGLLRTLQGDLASCTGDLGDHAAARALFEEALASGDGGSVPGFDQARVKANFGVLLYQTGDLDAALGLFEEAADTFETNLHPNHRFTLTARDCISRVLFHQGRFAEARAMQERVLAGFETMGQAGYSGAAAARSGLVLTLTAQGEVDRAVELGEESLRWMIGRLAPDDRFVVATYLRLAWAQARRGDADGIERALGGLLESLRSTLQRGAALSLRGRQELVRTNHATIASLLALAEVLPEGRPIHREAFEVVERFGELACSPPPWRGVAEDDPIREKVERLQELRREIARRTIHRQLSRGDDPPSLFDVSALSRERDRIEAELAERPELSLAAARTGIELPDVACSLPEGSALVVYRRYGGGPLDPASPTGASSEARMMATVLTPDGRFRQVRLGPIEAVKEAVDAWRAAVFGAESAGSTSEARSAGLRLRQLVLDPVLEHTGTARRLVVRLDDLLHLVPLDVLPLPPEEGHEGEGFVGDRFRVVRCVSLKHLPGTATRPAGDVRFVALGGIDYDAEAAGLPPSARPIDGVFRGRGPGDRWEPLPGALEEVRAIGELFRGAFDHDPDLLTGAAATKRSLFGLAPSATFLHVATHGYFAPAGPGTGPLPEDSLWSPMAFDEAVNELAPMTLCGLALSGGNRGPAADGIVTAEELAGLDLSRCELAVLAACDTDLGVQREGQRVQSFLTALEIAGVHTAVTSLWEVPDSSARELMLDFYERIWDRGETRAEAFWNARMTLHRRRLPMRDWCGWVMVGD